MSRNKKILVILFALALVLRGYILFDTFERQALRGITGETLDVASHIIRGHGISNSAGSEAGFEPNYHELPGYSLFVAAPMYFFGPQDGPVINQILQIILSASGVFLIFGIARRLFDQRVGLGSAVLWMLAIPEAHISTHLLHDAPMSFFGLSSAYFFVKGAVDGRVRHFIAASALVGLGSMFRSDLLLLPIFYFLGLLVYRRREWKQHMFRGLAMGVCTFLLVLPWGLRNYFHFKEFVITRTVLWQSMWEGFGEFKNPFGAVLDDAVTADQISAEYGKDQDEMTDSEYQGILKRKTLAALKSDPGWYVGTLLPKRLVRMVLIGGYGFWNDFFYPNPEYSYTKKYLAEHPGGNPFGYILFLARTNTYEFISRTAPIAYKGLLLLLGAGGIIAYRKKWREIMLIGSVYAYGIAAHLPIYWEPRYLIPTEFPLLIFATLFFAALPKLNYACK